MQNLNTPVRQDAEATTIQGLSLVELAKEYGTPLYVYDLDHVVAQYQSLFQAIDWPKLKIFYAMKANFNPDILRALLAQGANIDLVSPAEAVMALKLGFTPDRLLYTANNLTMDEIHQVKKLGLLLNIDSLSCLKKFGSAYRSSEVCLRFNSDVIAGENEKVQTGGDKTKFGIRLDDVEEALAIVREYDLKVVGLHEHTGSGIAKADEFCQGMKNLLSIATAERFPLLRFVDFGGGFKVPYRPDETRIDYLSLGKAICDIFREFCARFGRELDLHFEPGKYMVAECGVLVTQINTIKDNRTRLIAGTDTGFTHLIRPVLYGAYHHVLNLSNPQGELKTYDICGNICETGDLFAEDRNVPELREGDIIALLNAGAYCYSMASHYNLRPLPTEVVIQNGKAKLSRKRETPEEMALRLL